MQKNCTEFIAYENLVAATGAQQRGRARRPAAARRRLAAPIEQAVPLVKRALKVLADREVSPQLGLLKSTLLQLDSSFSERDYGAGSFRDFAEKLARRASSRSRNRRTLVELAEGVGARRGRTASEGEQGARSRPRRVPRGRAQGDRWLRARHRPGGGAEGARTLRLEPDRTDAGAPDRRPAADRAARAASRSRRASGDGRRRGSARRSKLFVYAERNPGSSPVGRAVHGPGHEIQRLVSTGEPTPEQLEVGVAALSEVLRAEELAGRSA